MSINHLNDLHWPGSPVWQVFPNGLPSAGYGTTTGTATTIITDTVVIDHATLDRYRDAWFDQYDDFIRRQKLAISNWRPIRHGRHHIGHRIKPAVGLNRTEYIMPNR